MKKGKSKEILIAIVVLSAIAFLFFGISFFKGENLLENRRVFYAVYNNVSGLTTNNAIHLNGFGIGKIKAIQLLPNSGGKILVAFTVNNKEVVIPSDSEARIESLDLLGTKVIAIRLGESPVYLESGDTLASSMENTLQDDVNAQIRPLKEKTEELIGSMDSAVTIVKAILNEDARQNLSASFKSIKRAIGTFESAALRLDTLIADEKIKVDRIFTNLESITGNVRRSNDDISRLLNNFATISDTLAKANIAETMLSANKALSEVAEVFDKINSGEGTVGMLIHNDTLYDNVEQAAKDLDLLLYDLQKNPQRYLHFSLFGRKNKNGFSLNKDEEERLMEILKEQ